MNKQNELEFVRIKFTDRVIWMDVTAVLSTNTAKTESIPNHTFFIRLHTVSTQKNAESIPLVRNRYRKYSLHTRNTKSMELLTSSWRTWNFYIDLKQQQQEPYDNMKMKKDLPVAWGSCLVLNNWIIIHSWCVSTHVLSTCCIFSSNWILEYWLKTKHMNSTVEHWTNNSHNESFSVQKYLLLQGLFFNFILVPM